jgi:hypothetical protein
MEYTIVWAAYTEELIPKVNELIKAGWKPLGGICIAEGYRWQAMIKE